MSTLISPEEAVNLLAAGAVLPLGTAGAGERAVPLTARTYRHPVLDDRVVVRLSPGDLGVAEDAAAGFLGLVLAGDPVEVGLGPRQALAFPEWILVHHPADGHQALALLPELERAAKQAKSKPKAALTAYQGIAERLAAALPHFLPTFYEQAGRVFLGVENSQYAAQMFTKARKAEAEHGLDLDADRLDAVFLEFALAGALPVKALVDYGKELSVRVPATEALSRFARLCTRRTAGGLVPSGQLATELRRLAKASGADAAAVEREYLVTLLALPATLRAPMAWWKGHRDAIVAIAKQDAEFRRVLLDVMPTNDDTALPMLWLGILEASGAVADLEDAAPDSARPEDGTVGWLRRFLSWRDSYWRMQRLPELYALIERCAGRIRSELAPGDTLDAGYDVDLLDLLLALDLPVAAPGDDARLGLERWADGEGQRDLLALAADERFRPAFRRAADGFDPDVPGLRAIKKLISSPGGRPMLTEWVADVANRFRAAGLPGLPRAMNRLTWLPGEALALAEEEARAAAATDLSPILARTLRAGVFDEFGWPAWDEATAELVAKKEVENLVVADAWPYLIVAGPTQVRVIDGEGTVLAHDLRIPAGDNIDTPGFHYVDGELLVHWRSRANDGRLQGYWHTSADHRFPVESRYNYPRGQRMYYYGPARLSRSLPLPGGGRTTGRAPLHRGDTVIPEDMSVISDGTSYWVWDTGRNDDSAVGWQELDPATGERGRRGLPGFLADAQSASSTRSGSVTGWVCPTFSDIAGPADRPVDGLVGFRVTRLPDGTQRGEDMAGVSVTVPEGWDLVRALLFPGDDRARALVSSGSWEVGLLDPDGLHVAEARTDSQAGAYAKGTRILPPISFWQYLRPRDLTGSLALRRLSADTAAALVEAGRERGVTKEVLRERIRALLPEVTADALIAGLTGIVREAVKQQVKLDKVAARLAHALDAGLEAAEAEPPGPTDAQLAVGLGGLIPANRWVPRSSDSAIFGLLRLLDREVHQPPQRTRRIETHLDGVEVQTGLLQWDAVIHAAPGAALRMVSPFIEPEDREVLRGLLGLLASLDLAGPPATSPWRRFTAHVAEAHLPTSEDLFRDSWLGLLPLADGAFAVVLNSDREKEGRDFSGLYHDPQGRFELPAPYTMTSVKPIGAEREAGWLTAFLAEAARRGDTAPWFAAKADEFADLTGVTPTTARLIVAGLPYVDRRQRNFLPAGACAALGVKAADAAVARERLESLGLAAPLLAALLPADPARLWSQGPDVAAAAEVWNRLVGKRAAVPEALLGQARRAVRSEWDVDEALPALLDPSASPALSTDLEWHIKGDRAWPVKSKKAGFTGETLVGSLALAAWLSHQVPAGDPVRDALPGALAAVRERLANPELLIDFGRYVRLSTFRKAVGPATETAEGFERYGAVLMATQDDQPAPAIRVALLDAAGTDPYLPALRDEDQTPFAAEIALRLARDPRFEALLADPGDPVGGPRGSDGTWWPQDPTRSVPDLVGEVAKAHGLGEDAAAVYLMLLAMPDPTDRQTARWTGWKPARIKAARAELAGTSLVVAGTRSRAGRSLFLPGGWADLRSPVLPMEAWKLPFYEPLVAGRNAVLRFVVPTEPADELYRRAWQRIQDGDLPRFEELKTARRGRRR